jgi:allantoin racemase
MSFNAGALAVRCLLGIPVLGITEAALHTACLLGRRFGLIVSGAVSVPLYLDLLEGSGLRARLAAMEILEVNSVAAYLDAIGLEAQLLEAAQRMSARPEIEAILLCGASFAGLAHRLQPHLAVPLIDGVAAATAQAELLVNLRLRPRNRLTALAAGLGPVSLGRALGRLLTGTSGA